MVEHRDFHYPRIKSEEEELSLKVENLNYSFDLVFFDNQHISTEVEATHEALEKLETPKLSPETEQRVQTLTHSLADLEGKVRSTLTAGILEIAWKRSYISGSKVKQDILLVYILLAHQKHLFPETICDINFLYDRLFVWLNWLHDCIAWMPSKYMDINNNIVACILKFIVHFRGSRMILC